MIAYHIFKLGSWLVLSAALGFSEAWLTFRAADFVASLFTGEHATFHGYTVVLCTIQFLMFTSIPFFVDEPVTQKEPTD